MNQEPFRQFAEKLVTNNGIFNFPEDFTAELKDMLTITIEQRIGFMVLNNLDEAGAEEFAVLMGREELPTPDDWLKFFQKNIPDFEKNVAAVLAEVAKDFERNNKVTA